MTDDMMSLQALLEKSSDTDLLRDMCPSWRQHDQRDGRRPKNFCRRYRGVTPVGPRPSCVTPR